MKQGRHATANIVLTVLAAALLLSARPLGAAPTRHKQQQRRHTRQLVEMVFTYPQRHGLSIGHIQSEVYIKYNLVNKRRNAAGRFTPFVGHMERGQHAYFGESVLKMQYSAAGLLEQKEVASYTTAPDLDDLSAMLFKSIAFTAYEPTFMNDRLLSPLNRDNRPYYRYRRVYDAHAGTGSPLVRISIIPKANNTQLINGYMEVDTTSGRVDRFCFRFKYNTQQIEFKAHMGREGSLSLLPDTLQAKNSFNFFGNTSQVAFTAIYRHTDIAPYRQDIVDSLLERNGYDLTHLKQLATDTTGATGNLRAIDSLRPIALTPAEDSIYAAHIGRLQAPPAHPAHARRNALTDRLEDILLSSHYLHFGTGNALRLPPIVTPSMVEWSNNKGLSLKTRIRFNSQWDNRQRLTARISAGYNFKRREFYWKAPVEWLFSPQHEGKITLEAGNGNHIYNSKQAKDIRQQMSSKQNYDSLINIFDRYAFDYYNDYYVKLQTSYDPWPGLSVNAGLVYHNRTLTDWNEIGGREGLIHRYRSLAPNLRVEWTPGLYYYRNKEEAVPLFSRWPTFSCEYERGIKAFHNGCAYERWELEGNYRFNLHALRYLYLRAGGGLYTQRENTYFVDYTNFRYSALPETWLDEMAGTFEALDSRWYNESKYYVRACTSYESPMLLLARFNPVSPIVKRERLYCNLLSVHALNPYVEIGYSMATHLFDIGLFVGAANRSGTSFGWKFVLRFYEDN